MNQIIINIAEWLTSEHAISLPGWCWLVLIPIAVIVIIVSGVFGFFFLTAAMLKGAFR